MHFAHRKFKNHAAIGFVCWFYVKVYLRPHMFGRKRFIVQCMWPKRFNLYWGQYVLLHQELCLEQTRSRPLHDKHTINWCARACIFTYCVTKYVFARDFLENSHLALCQCSMIPTPTPGSMPATQPLRCSKEDPVHPVNHCNHWIFKRLHHQQCVHMAEATGFLIYLDVDADALIDIFSEFVNMRQVVLSTYWSH